MPVASVQTRHSCLLCSLQELETAVGRSFPTALRRAAQLGRPVILRLALDARSAPFWSLLPYALRQRERYALWHDPEGDLGFVAVGELMSLEVRSGAPLPQLRSFWHQASAAVLEPTLTAGSTRRFAGGLEVQPLIVGGLAFGRHEPGPDDAWHGWPAARFWVPELLLQRRLSGAAEGCRLIYHMLVKADDSLQARLDAVRRRLEHLQSSAFHEQKTASSQGAHPRWLPQERQDQFCRRVQAARQAVAAGELAKVVLARAATLDPPQGHVFDLAGSLERLRASQPGAVCFALAGAALSPAGPCFLGASPELLVRLLGRRFQSIALAGTAARDADPGRDAELGRGLLASAKDRHEQALVVAAVEEAVEPLSTVLNVVKKPRLRRLPNAQHLESPVSGMLRPGAGIFDLLEALHPTPAVGGSPTERAGSWLREHESLERGWYAAPVGWLDDAGNGSFAVAIRSALLSPRRAWAFAGAGIVAGSDPHAEWAETELKLQTVARHLATRPEGQP